MTMFGIGDLCCQSCVLVKSEVRIFLCLSMFFPYKVCWCDGEREWLFLDMCPVIGWQPGHRFFISFLIVTKNKMATKLSII